MHMTRTAALILLRRCDALRAREQTPGLTDPERRRLRHERAMLAERAAPYVLGAKPYDEERP
jgi:hypothetical protein